MIPLSNLQSASAADPPRSLLQRIEDSTSPEADDVITFESAIRHLRARGVEDQLTILEALRGAANEAELRTNRTLRTSVTRTMYFYGFAHEIRIPLPPLQSVTSVKYYDTDDTLQTISSSDYAVHTPTKGVGRVVFQSDYSFPNVNTDRPDIVQIICVTGWGTDDVIPGVAKTGVRLLTVANYDMDEKARTEAYRVLQPLIYRGTE
jgi:hypothetical protein